VVNTRARRTIARRWVVLAAAATIVMTVVVGCSLVSASLNRPTFKAPVEWGAQNGENAQRGGTTVSTTLQLFANGRARLKNFPQGTDGRELSSYGTSYSCLQISTGTRYTGRATWTAPDAGEFILRFGKSSVEVAADTDGYIGRTPDWDFVWILECDSGDLEWDLGYACGDAGNGDAGRLDIPCTEDQSAPPGT
jgi:hypothetical protein